MAMIKPITVKFNPDLDEYRVPGKNQKREAEAYYTNDRRDAVQTALLIHGTNINIKVRRVENF